MNPLFGPDSSHWYYPDGTAAHTVTGANGQPRSATLRDARKLGLLPSVTNILGIIAKPELTAWLQEQAVLSALTLPRAAGETEEAFARRVVADSATPRDRAADFGTRFHAGAQVVVQGGDCSDDALQPWLAHFRNWWFANAARPSEWTERVLVNKPGGYAGTADLLMHHRTYGLCLVDYKTQKGGERRALKPYRSWLYQLAAYRSAWGEPVGCMNLIVDSTTPAEPVEIVYSVDELARGWEVFQAAALIWRMEKGYDGKG